MRLAITTFATLLTLSTGCLQPHTTGDDDGSWGGGGGGGGGSGSYPPPPSPVASGSYDVTSRIDITIETLLPQPVEQIVVTARDFSTNPAHTLLDLAEAAGVPAVGTIRDALPSVLEEKLEGWMNDEINKLTIGGIPVTQIAGHFAALAETTLTQVELESTLTISGSTATHELTALDLGPTGIDKRFELGAAPADIVTATTTASSTKGVLSIGDHQFGLAYGEYAWAAIESQCTAEYGQGIRATLGAAVSCPTLAAKIANKCVFGLCVGHATELTSICERGLDEVVERVHAKFSAMRFDAIHFAAGKATVTSTGLTGGVWTAEINAGQGLRHVPATFTATK